MAFYRCGSSGGSDSGVALYSASYGANSGTANQLSAAYFDSGTTTHTTGTISDSYVSINYTGYGYYTVTPKVGMTLSSSSYRYGDSSAVAVSAKHFNANETAISAYVNCLAVFIHSLD